MAFTALGFNKQDPGSNENAWGEVLNDEVIELIDAAIRGRTAFALSGSKTLTSTNGEANESRAAILHITSGTGGAVTLPAISKLYMVFNQSSGDVTLAPSGGNAATVETTEACLVFCDGTNAYSLGVGGESWKAYVDAQAFAALEGDLPAQPGNDGKVLKTNGTVAGWEAITDLDDYTNDQTAREASLKAFALAAAVAL